jgi:hypothetical protein
MKKNDTYDRIGDLMVSVLTSGSGFDLRLIKSKTMQLLFAKT